MIVNESAKERSAVARRNEARRLLSAYGVGGQDADDPRFREALEMLKADPELAQWFAREQSWDSIIMEQFASFPVPPGLKSRLLAARKVVPLLGRPKAPRRLVPLRWREGPRVYIRPTVSAKRN